MHEAGKLQFYITLSLGSMLSRILHIQSLVVMLLLFALAHPIPFDIFSERNISSVDLVEGGSVTTTPCLDIDKCRTITDILWNCYSVIILCTWVAVHPDTPQHNDHLLVVLMKYGIVFFMAIIAPELMILWALRQWVSCRRITAKYSKYGWTKCHAFLVLMGGLALYDEDEYVCHLWDRNAFNDIIVVSEGDKEQNVESQGPNGRDTKLATLIVNGRPFKGDTKSFKSSVQQLIVGKHIHEKQRYSCLLEFLLAKGHIRITEEEIKDKGHADALTKTIAITQTTWFILQCSARAVQGLDVTALEVFTFAFAVLNFVTYFLWWNKPLRVRHPVRVYWRPQPPKLRDQIGETPPWYRRLWKGLSAAMPMLYKECAQGFDAVSEYIAKDFKYLAETKNLRPLKCPFGIGLLFYPIVSLYTRFEEFMIGYDSDELRYLFSSRLDKDPLGIHITAFMVAVIFGAIQCIPWFFPFPTPVERLTWTIIAVVMLAGPVAFGTLYLFIRCLISKWMERQLGNSEWTRAILKKVKIWKDQKRSTHLLKVLAIYWTVAYVAGRSALIVLALLALRGLSRQGYEAVEWNAFFPHIG